MLSAELLDFTEQNEGYKQFSYQCTAGKNTVGIGFNLDDVGLSLEESQVILSMRMEKIINRLDSEFLWFKDLTPARMGALADMAYQLGINGLFKFKKSLALMELGRYEDAAIEFLDSKWASQTPNRANKVVKMIATGDYA